MTVVRFIGDCHGKFERYKKLIKDQKHTRQVGDFGVGFFTHDPSFDMVIPTSNPPYEHIMRGDHKFIRGNHDNPNVCARQKYYIPDGTIEVFDGVKIMYIGGAKSVDREWRTEGFDWWADEELSHFKLQCFTDLYEVEKPDVMVTHDVPEEVAKLIETLSGRRKLDMPSITRQALDSMLWMHKPKHWFHGHWHYAYDYEYKGTMFHGLAELGVYDLDMETVK